MGPPATRRLLAALPQKLVPAKELRIAIAKREDGVGQRAPGPIPRRHPHQDHTVGPALDLPALAAIGPLRGFGLSGL